MGQSHFILEEVALKGVEILDNLLPTPSFLVTQGVIKTHRKRRNL